MESLLNLFYAVEKGSMDISVRQLVIKILKTKTDNELQIMGKDCRNFHLMIEAILKNRKEK